MNKYERWKKLEALLSEVLREIGPSMNESNRTLVRDFIENREYQVAHDWVVDLLESGAATSTPHATERLSEVAGLFIS